MPWQTVAFLSVVEGVAITYLGGFEQQTLLLLVLASTGSLKQSATRLLKLTELEACGFELSGLGRISLGLELIEQGRVFGNGGV